MIITLSGENDYLIKDKLDHYKIRYQDHEDIDILSVDLKELKFNLQNMSLFSESRCIILYQPSRNKDFKNDIEEITNNLPDKTILIIIEHQFDKRSSYYKYLHKYSEFYEFNALESGKIQEWIKDYVKQQKGTISLYDIRLLISLIGNNQFLIKNELDKLLTYNSDINRESIELLVEPVPSSTIFELIDASLYSDLKKAFKIYSLQRSQKVEPQTILGMFIWQLHILALIKTYKGNSHDFYKELSLNPYVIEKSIKLSKNIDLNKLKGLITYLKKADLESKTKYISLDEYLKNFLIKLSYN